MRIAQASMNINDVFNLILKRLAGAADGFAYFGQDELDGFSVEVVDALKTQGVLSQYSDAKELTCFGCELYCNRPVRFQRTAGSPVKAFIACDMPDYGDGEGDVPLSRLKQFKASEQQLAQLIAKLCGMSQTVTKQNHIWYLGVYGGKKHQAALTIDFRKSVLLINDFTVPLNELLSFSRGNLNIDTSKVMQAIDFGLAPAGKAQNNAIRKSKTQARNDVWKTEYKQLKKEKPNFSDAQIAQLIAKKPIADGKNSETIRKNMK